MALTRGLGAYDDGTPEEPGPGTTPRDVRMALAGLFSGPGVLPGGDTPLVSGTTGWAYRVGRKHFVTQLTASDGMQLFSNDGAATVDRNADGTTLPQGAPSSGLTRIDIVWVRHPTNDENGDTSSQPVFGVEFGIPGAPGLAPTIPPGAIELGRNTMSSTATSTSSTGNSIQNTALTTQLVGTPGRWKPLQLANGWANAYAGAACEYRLDEDMWELRGAAFYAAGVPTSAVLLTAGNLTPVPSAYDINHVLPPVGLGPVGNRFATLNPRPDGNIRVYASATGGSLLVLDGTKFRAF